LAVARRERGRRFIRYALGSVLATIASAVAFALAYRVLHADPRVSSVTAFAAGALVNFVANRFWAFGDRVAGPAQRLGLGRDLASYAVIAVAIAATASGATTLAEWLTRRAGLGVNAAAVLVEGAYFATYAAMFLVKFVLLDRLVFRSRAQVENTTRA
jgi:putative flippase GtrA